MRYKGWISEFFDELIIIFGQLHLHKLTFIYLPRPACDKRIHWRGGKILECDDADTESDRFKKIRGQVKLVICRSSRCASRYN